MLPGSAILRKALAPKNSLWRTGVFWRKEFLYVLGVFRRFLLIFDWFFTHFHKSFLILRLVFLSHFCHWRTLAHFHRWFGAFRQKTWPHWYCSIFCTKKCQSDFQKSPKSMSKLPLIGMTFFFFFLLFSSGLNFGFKLRYKSSKKKSKCEKISGCKIA